MRAALRFLFALGLQFLRPRPVGALLSRGDSAHSGEARSQNPYELHYDSCSCDFRNLECLPSAACLQAVKASSGELIRHGVWARRALKKMYESDNKGHNDMFVTNAHPLGKVITYGAITNWRRWATGMEMLPFYPPHAYKRFIDPERYPECKNSSLDGASCFWKPFAADEDFGELERNALAEGGLAMRSGESEQDLVEGQQDSTEGPKFQKFQMNVASAIVPGTSEQNDAILNSLPADLYLLSIAHIARMQFNMRQNLQNAYKKYNVVVNPGVGQLRVGVHIRRSDACSELNNQGYKKEASKIGDGPQMTNVRMCYHTSVYINMLRRVKDLYGMPLAVYLSSDDTSSILDEIRSLSPDLFESSSWHHLSFPQDVQEALGYFDKTRITVEFQSVETSALLGETAALDAWHLSHSEVFVGHLGSRFGKGAYLLAVSRHNVPIPYISVDGHSYCCASDEHCSRATKALTGMIDCTQFVSELAPNTNPNMAGTYWEDGVTIRWDRDLSSWRPRWPRPKTTNMEAAINRPAGLR